MLLPHSAINTRLLAHPATSHSVAQSIAVHTVFQSDGALRLTYHITARPAQLSIPAPCPPSFTDGLWQHTCLEVFVATPGEEAYREFNFSPSGQWAAYAFHAYRQRNPDFSPALAPQISISHRTDGLTLEALLPAALLPQAEGSAELQLGLSAIIEDNSGDLSYWALAHPAERPDFHHHT